MQIEALDEFRYRIPRDQSRGMRADVLVFASRRLMEPTSSACLAVT